MDRSRLQQTRGFRKAVKFDARARVALIGVSGSGKSFTGLTLARALAGPTGRIACIDTEHGSLSKYADLFSFDVDEPDSYTTEYLLHQLDFAEANGYAVFLVDSLSHFWMGKDGALEYVDHVAKRTRNGDSWVGWKAFAPHERAMVDRFLASPCHVIVTMRVKTEYQEVMVDGKKKRVKIGLEPVQRQGLEYEFDLVCSMDDENNLLVDKTRCGAYSQERMRAAAKPGAQYFESFIDWLTGVEPAAQTARPGGPTIGRREPERDAAEQKTRAAAAGALRAPTFVEDLADWPENPRDLWIRVRGVLYCSPAQDGRYEEYVAPTKTGAAPTPPRLASKAGEIRQMFQQIRERIGEVRYLEELHLASVNDPLQFRSRDKAQECFNRMWMLSQMKEVA